MGGKKIKNKKQIEAENLAREEETKRLEEESRKRKEEEERIQKEEEEQRRLKEEQRKKDEFYQIEAEKEEFKHFYQNLENKCKEFYSGKIKDRTWDIYTRDYYNPFPLDITKLNRFLDEKLKAGLFQPNDLVPNVSKLHNLLVNLRDLLPLYQEVSDIVDLKTLIEMEKKATENKTKLDANLLNVKTLLENETMIVEFYKMLINNAMTLSLYKVDEFFACLTENRENKDNLKVIQSHAKDLNFFYGVYLIWDKDRGIKIRFDETFNVQYEARNFQEKEKKMLFRTCWLRYDWKTLNLDPNYIVVNGILEWDLYYCPNNFKIYPNCKVKEDVSSKDLEDRKRDINRKELTVNINLSPDLFIQNVENIEDEEENDLSSKRRYELEIVYYDDESKCWRNDGISMKKRNRDVIIFKTQINSPHAIVVKRNIDFPFKNFFIRNVGDAIYVDIETKRIELKFKISLHKGRSYITLLNDIDGLLTQFVGKVMSPIEILYKLQIIGINLLPLESDREWSKKTKAVNDFAYKAVSILSTACSFRSTHFCHSTECGDNQIILKMRENEDNVIYYDEDERRDYKYICIYEEMIGLIETSHLDTELNMNLKADSKNHFDLTKFVAEVYGEEMADRIRSLDDTSMRNIITLRNFLKAMRIFEITKTEDMYVEPNFEYENMTLPEEQMEEKRDDLPVQNVEMEGANDQ